MARKLFLPFFILFLFANLGFAENPFTPTTKGMKLEYIRQDKNGKTKGYLVKTVENCTETPDGLLVETRSITLDKDRKQDNSTPVMSSKALVTQNEVLILKESFSSLFGDMNTKADFAFEGDNMVYPVIPQINQVIQPFTIEIVIVKKESENRKKVATIMSEKRKVTGKETVTVEAGSYDCFVVVETIKLKAMLGIGSTSYSSTWYASGIGEVISQELTKKGKVEETTKLISVTYP